MSLADISRLLATIPAPAMPDRLTERVQAAIAAEAAERAANTTSTAGYAASADPSPVRIPGRPDLPQHARTKGQRWRMPDLSSPVLLRALAATAAVVVVVGGGLLLANTGGKPKTASAPVSAAHVKTRGASSLGFTELRYRNNGRYVVTDAVTSGANYTEASLANGVRQAVASSPRISGAAGSATPLPTNMGTNAAPSSTKAPASAKEVGGAFPLSQLGACLSTIASGKTVLVTVLAHYLRMPVAIIVLGPAHATFDVIVVSEACGLTGQGIIRTLTLPRI